MPVGADYSTDGSNCQCYRGSECARPGKHPVSAREHLGPFYVDGVSLTAPHCYASREFGAVQDWVASRYSLAAYPLGFVVVDEEGRGKDGHASLREWARLYGIDLGEVTNTLNVLTGGGGRHYWLALPEPWRSAPPEPMDGWLPGIDIKIVTADHPDSKATLPGSAHASGGLYRFALRDGVIPDPREAPVRLLEAIAQGRRWEPLPEAKRRALRPLTANEHLTGNLRAWRQARRFLGPEQASPPRGVWRGINVGSMSQLAPDHYLRSLTS